MSDLQKTSFYPATSSDAQTTFVPRKKKRSRNTPVSLELVRNLSTDFKPPQQLAASGDLESLKSFLELFGITLKERDENQATLLHHAASANQIAVMNYLINSGIELNATDKDGHTALHIAAIQGHIEALNLLLDNGINDSILNKELDAAFHIAVRVNNTDLVAAFLEHPDIDLVVAGYRKRTPLHVISEYDNVEVCEVIHNSILVKEHFKKKTCFRLCAADEDDLTPIHLAARKGSHRVLDMYMTKCKLHGYPPEVVLGFIDEENSTPLHAAIDGGHTKVVEVLLKHGADPMVQKDSQIPPFLLACSQGKMDMIEIMLKCNNSDEVMACCDVYGHGCLHHSAQAINSSQIIPYLVSKGVQVNSLDNKGQTPLMMSIIAGSTSGVSTLLELGADVLIKDIEGKSALHHAVTRNRHKIALMLLELPCACSLVMNVDNRGNSPIHHALKLGLSTFVNPMIAVIQCKLKNVKDCKGNNYLHLAAGSGNWRALTILLEIQECLKLLNETNNGGHTPLHTASLNGHTNCVEILLSHGAMIHKCHYGLTPFMYACYNGHAEVARILFTAHPFQLNWNDDKGQSPLHLAVASGNPQIITLLLDIGVPVTHNFAQESFFDQLIEKNDVRSAAAVIGHDRYQECLDLGSPVHPHPIIQLITHMPEIARKVLDRSHMKAELDHANPDYWEKFDFKYLHLKKIPEHYSEEQETDGSDEDETEPMIADEKETMQSHVIKYKGSLSAGSTAPNLKKPCPKISHLVALRTMVKHDRNTLLTHPVSNAYLKCKWSNYGRWVHITLSSFIFFQVLFLFLFTALIPNPSIIQANPAPANSSISCIEGTNGTMKCLEFSYVSNVCRFIALALACFNFIVWLYVVIQLRLEALNVIKNSYVLVDLMSVAFTLYYLLPSRGLNNANWEAGAVAVFFAWFSFVLKIQLFDLFGVYVTMFLAITRRALQVLLICFIFVLSFGVSFYILTGNLKQYSSIGYSLFVNFGHLLGEIDYISFVQEDVNGNLNFDGLTFIFVTALAVLMAIVIMNLLIGLAVGDIDAIRSNAIAEKKSIEVDFFGKVDIILPKKLIQRLDKPFCIKYPNRHTKNIVRKMWHFFWQSLKGKDTNFDADIDDDFLLDDSIDQKTKDIITLKERMDELSMSQGKILHTLKEMQENLMKFMITLNTQRGDEAGDD